MNWPQIAVLSEEIAYNIKLPNVILPPQEPFVPTEEKRPTTAHIINHHIKANIWAEIKMPRDMEAWQMSCRDDYDVYYCFEPSASTYKTLKAGAIVSEDTSPNKTLNSIYLRCANDTIIEIELWLI